ncbi:hypothetical protein LCGC14_1230560 [marine sediment metagenome]|uniref:Uncharacterized protein n=1 Tax=marine sediment metagenome TaxID=412755 RepID=A0A0F9LVV6_9ZZZZ
MLSSLPEIQKRQEEVSRLDFSERGTAKERQELYLKTLEDFFRLRLSATFAVMEEKAFYGEN